METKEINMNTKFDTYVLPIKLLTATAKLPTKENAFDAGLDLFCDELEKIKLLPGERRLFSTGISMAIPDGYVGLIWPRSGHAVKAGIDTMAGVIDATYRGHVKVLLVNHSDDVQVFEPGERIAQIIIQKSPNFMCVKVDDLNDTARGSGGFGSTGR